MATPISISYHDYHRHHHYKYNKHDKQAKEEFREWVNLILKRNSLAYFLNSNGCIEKISPLILGKLIHAKTFNSGDKLLDELLNEAVNMFISPKFEIRRNALEKLWDSWERLKSLACNTQKKKPDSIKKIIDVTAGDANGFDIRLNTEARELSDIGNKRHSQLFMV